METKTQLQVTNSFARWVERNAEESRVCSLLCYAIHADRHTHPSVSRITTDSLNYLTNRTDGTISFLPKGRQLEYTDDSNSTWSRKGRQDGRPAKVVQKLFSPHVNRLLKSRDWEKFTALYQAASVDAQLHEFEGDDILRAYDGDACGRPMFSSCMNGESHLLSLYETAPVRLFALSKTTEDGSEEMHARALVWSVNGITVADRIYSSSDKYRERLRMIFEERGFYTRACDSWTNKTDFISPTGEHTTLKLQIPVEHTPGDAWPYMDTFSYAIENPDGSLTLTNDIDTDHVYLFDSTGGGCKERRKCYPSDRYITREGLDNFVFSDHYNRWLLRDEARQLGVTWIHQNDIERRAVVLADRLPEAIADVQGRYYIDIARMRTRTLCITPIGNFVE